MDSKKWINSFEMKKRIGHLIIYATMIFFGNFWITFFLIFKFLLILQPLHT